MTLIARPPSDPRLAPLVTCVWYSARALDHPHERVLPSGAMQLVVDLRSDANRGAAAFVVGPQRQSSLIATAAMRRSAGIAFRVGAGMPVIGGPCAALRDATTDLADFWGADAERLRDALDGCRHPAAVLGALEAFLVGYLGARPSGLAAPDAATRHGLRVLAGGHSVADTIARTGLSRAGFARLFDREVGLSPKRWAGIARFQRAAKRLMRSPIALADLAAACGYADQAHLTRDFRRYAAVTPRSFRPRSADERNHLLA